MPLPVQNTAWPPKPYDRVAKAVDECAAWWEGDANRLSGLYQASDHSNRISSSNGFIAERIGNMFWGRRQTVGQSTRRVHVPIAADLAHTSATLMFSDPPSFSIANPDHSQAAAGTLVEAQSRERKRLDLIVNTPEMHSKLLVAGEATAALGGSYVRVCWNTAVADNAWLEFVDADCAFPEWRYGRLHAVTFWTVIDIDEDKNTFLRHIEVHESGKITHGLYRGTRDNLGKRINLSEHTSTAGLAVNEAGEMPTGVKRLTAGYIPNARPNPEWRNHGQLSLLGRPDISRDVISLMDHVDEAYSALARDVRLAKARIVVSEHLLQTGRPGEGSTFDADREAFTALATAPNGQSPVIEMRQFDIRVEQHLGVADAYLREILRRVGYSPLTFGLADDSTSAMTATEIAVKERASIATHTAKSRLWQAALAPIMRTLLEIDASLYGTKVTLDENIEVDWPSAVRETELSKARTVQALETARAASTETKVAMLHPAWDEKRREIEVQKILAENSVSFVDPYTIGGDPGDSNIEDDDQIDESTRSGD